MGTSLVSFNAVRPVLFAGTLAVAWLAFSAPSSAADTSPDSGSVLGTISAAASPVSSTAVGGATSAGSVLDTSAAAVAESAVPAAPAPRPPVPATPVAHAPVPGPSQSVPENLAGFVSVPVAPLPVVNRLDPADTVATTIVPANPVIDVVSLALDGTAVPDGALQPVADVVTKSAGPLGSSPVLDAVTPITTPVLDAVTPITTPVLDAVTPITTPVLDAITPVASPVLDAITPVASPVLDAVTPVPSLRPVPDLGTDVAPLHVSAFIPGTVDDRILSELSAADAGAAAGSTGSRSTAPRDALIPCGLLTGFLSTLLVPAAAASFAGPGSQAGAGAPPGSSGDTGPMPAPMWLPVSGSGSVQSSGGSQTIPAAWLSNNFEYLPLPGIVPVSGPLQHVPAPVSFDPGSSPD